MKVTKAVISIASIIAIISICLFYLIDISSVEKRVRNLPENSVSPAPTNMYDSNLEAQRGSDEDIINESTPGEMVQPNTQSELVDSKAIINDSIPQQKEHTNSGPAEKSMNLICLNLCLKRIALTREKPLDF
jgi:hypothetical protein